MHLSIPVNRGSGVCQRGFADMQIPELVTVFNAHVQSRGWSSMRAYHDQALLVEFQCRGIDITDVYDGKTISFAHTVWYDIANNRLIANC